MDLEALQNLRSALACLARKTGQGAIPCHNHGMLPLPGSLRRHSQKSASLVLYFWILSLPIILFIVFISPYVLEPMFNKFEP